jgi:hypothetical protein
MDDKKNNYFFNKDKDANKYLKGIESLKSLVLYDLDLSKITSFPKEIEILHITNCKNIKEIFKNSNIKCVIFHGTDFTDFKEIKISNATKDITIKNCKNIENFIGRLPKNIDHLKIVDCDLLNISKIPNYTNKINFIKKYITNSLPDKLIMSKYIEKLDIRNCKNPESLINKLKNVTNMNLYDLNLKDAIYNGNNSPELKINNCENILFFKSSINLKNDKSYNFIY